MSEAEECGSGGCWRELVLRPRDGQSPEQVAAAMGVTGTRTLGWHVLDPHGVVVSSQVVDGDLRVRVGY